MTVVETGGGPVHEQLEALLTEETEIAQRLLDSLDVEHVALKAHDPRALEQAVAHKQDLIQTLEALGQQRMTALRVTPGSLDGDAIASRLRDYDTHGKLLPLWAQLQQTARRCQRQNHRNGVLVNAHQHRTEHILGILRGQPVRAGLYGPDGGTVADGASHTSIKA